MANSQPCRKSFPGPFWTGGIPQCQEKAYEKVGFAVLKQKVDDIDLSGMIIISIVPRLLPLGGASRRRIWTKIGGNESQDLPGPPYSPQNPRFRPENLENNPIKIQQKNFKIRKKYLMIALYCPIIVMPAQCSLLFPRISGT